MDAITTATDAPASDSTLQDLADVAASTSAESESIAPVAPDLDTVEGIAELVTTSGDARVDEPGKLVALRASIRATLGGVKDAYDNYQAALNRATLACAESRRFILDTNGLPMWNVGAKNKVYNGLVDSLLTSIDFGKGNGSIRSSIRTGMASWALLHVVRQYVRDTVQGMPAEGEQDTDAFRFNVRSEFVRCGLKTPKGYETPEEVTAAKLAADSKGQAGPGKGKAGPAEFIAAHSDAVKDANIVVGALNFLAAGSALVDKLTSAGTTSNIDQAIAMHEYAARILVLAEFVEKYPNVDDSDVQAAKDACYVEGTDTF